MPGARWRRLDGKRLIALLLRFTGAGIAKGYLFESNIAPRKSRKLPPRGAD
jgi:hypothetical protein